MKLELRDEIRAAWADKDAFAEAARLQGTIYRNVDGRRTLRFELGCKHYFLKYHEGIGWRELFKNLLQLKLPVLGAGVEWRAIEHLHDLGLDTLEAVGFGEWGWNPARRRSFLITRELVDTLSVEDLVLTWNAVPPAPALKHSIIRALAQISGRMHRGGINHRDLYVCHFLLATSGGLEALDPASIRLFVVDLHRAQVRKRVPMRWLVKDLASIYYSLMNAGITRNDVFRFMRVYSGKPLRQILVDDRRFWSRVQKRAVAFHWEYFGKPPPVSLFEKESP